MFMHSELKKHFDIKLRDLVSFMPALMPIPYCQLNLYIAICSSSVYELVKMSMLPSLFIYWQ